MIKKLYYKAEPVLAFIFTIASAYVLTVGILLLDK